MAFDPKAGWTPVCDCRPVFPSLAQPSCIHITDVRTVNPDASLLNDTVVDFTTLASGLKIVCDGTIDPASIKPATCYFTLDLPVPPVNLQSQIASGLPVIFEGGVPITLNASVNASGNSIFWLPFQDSVSSVLQQLADYATKTLATGRVLGRLTLKGNFIWSLTCPSITLDGDVLAKPQRDASGNLFSALQLPSGDGRPGGNFESWVWVPGYCDKTFPANFIPFQQITSIAGPDASGDRVVVGFMTGPNFHIAMELQPTDVTVGKIYCQPVQIAPGTFGYAYVATKAERQGNFSDISSPIIDPVTNYPFPGNIIPSARLPAGGAGEISQGVFAWRMRTILLPYGFYGYGAFQGIGVELL
jgi:hypothetical protein